MKTAIREILFLLCSLAFSLMCLVSFNEDIRRVEVFDILSRSVPGGKGIPRLPAFLRTSKVFICVVVCFLICSILVRMTRLIVNSRNTDRIGYFFSYVTYFLVGLPFAHLITYIVLGGKLQDNQMDDVRVIKIGLICIAGFYVISRLLSYSLHKAYLVLLNKPTQNYMLQIRSFQNPESDENVKTVIRRRTFDECFNLVRYYAEPMGADGFFTISEVSWTGRKTIGSWNYYRNGDLIENLDEIMQKRNSLDPGVKWGM